ncbi:MAG: sigma-70 family RNA polymerase sigma factor [Acetobacter sp.]|nr:sigma-70 family RNA polymerase sigma factor [Bacteroides sp.]MCM1341764.1 sigma-70 family RNA polymerase sigma factor [Acetobacter sp.]MCM1433107.1 sigma-70 family RNA polymerase sigma factor [Clostridiales bacterium]
MEKKKINELFDEFYDKYSKYIFNYFKKEFGKEDAEDLTQQVFLQLWQWLPNSSVISNKKSFIFKIAKNVKYDKLRKNLTALSTTPLLEEFILEDMNNSYNIIDIKLSINKLSPKEQQTLYLKLHGYSSKEIGETFDISPSAVRTRLQKIRKKLL